MEKVYSTSEMAAMVKGKDRRRVRQLAPEVIAAGHAQRVPGQGTVWVIAAKEMLETRKDGRRK